MPPEGMHTIQPIERWRAFRDAFRRQVYDATDATLAEGWSAHGGRTTLYARTHFPALAPETGLVFCRELLVVDYALCQRVSDGASNEELVPVVFAESESDAALAHQEVGKLCALAAPVRVLLTVAQWSHTPGVWPAGGHATQYLGRWRAVCATHAAVLGGLQGVVACLVGEWGPDHVLRFYAHRLGGVPWPDADVDRDGAVIVERPMGGTPGALSLT